MPTSFPPKWPARCAGQRHVSCAAACSIALQACSNACVISVRLQVFIARATDPVAISAYQVTFSMAAVAGVANCVFGFLLAWVLVKFDFPGAWMSI